MKFFLLVLLGLTFIERDGLANEASKQVPKYFCAPQLEVNRGCLKREIRQVCDSLAGCMPVPMCIEYSNNVIQTWIIIVTDSAGKQFSGGEFPDGSSAMKRLNQLVDSKICY